MRYLGLDVGKRYVQACLLNDDGSVVREGRYRYDEEGLRDVSLLLDEDDMAVLESTGNLWVRIYDLLRDRGVRVKLANPLKTKAIASAKIKSDKIDAKILAYLLKSDLIPESYVPDKYIMDIRRLIKHRVSLVKSRTIAKNTIHSSLMIIPSYY